MLAPVLVLALVSLPNPVLFYRIHLVPNLVKVAYLYLDQDKLTQDYHKLQGMDQDKFKVLSQGKELSKHHCKW
ncbi:hypothetical protein CONCODRAFT_11140 [Conidiobolus coronatus NRRL 28638]|uniref:Uncharacterized protein n=1 Tax=Conidiobolus coronatus (strain ATCC 28846 / CBS 209.66 / NRRL 28638) TaxID=796925 RepID=A0A137NW49_CONC2|nr:hypothetical protein CONCODRAFT_11140 [Conidiobolus coronatus NRRL 28638]|eukprot:KXN66901.1 hypothetical protein CONCODRAFT_11140 [Conidiobolus coronatus NRRL 28638]